MSTSQREEEAEPQQLVPGLEKSQECEAVEAPGALVLHGARWDPASPTVELGTLPAQPGFPRAEPLARWGGLRAGFAAPLGTGR